MPQRSAGTAHPVRREGSAQRLVPHDQVDERPVQGARIEVAGDPQDCRDVVGDGSGVALIDEPHPALGERQRNTFRRGSTATIGARDDAFPATAAISSRTLGALNASRTDTLDAEDIGGAGGQAHRRQ